VDAGGLDRGALLGCFPAARAALPAGGDPVVAGDKAIGGFRGLA
jgi:hypothetical protein